LVAGRFLGWGGEDVGDQGLQDFLEAWLAVVPAMEIYQAGGSLGL
jgi:hypothetical protein